MRRRARRCARFARSGSTPICPVPAVPAAEPFRYADDADVGEMCGKGSASSSKSGPPPVQLTPATALTKTARVRCSHGYPLLYRVRAGVRSSRPFYIHSGTSTGRKRADSPPQPGRCAMNALNDVAEARASALSLRASAKACTGDQGALKFRLVRAAESLDAMVLLAMRGLDRIEQLEQQLADIAAGSGEPAEPPAVDNHSAGSSALPVGLPMEPIFVGGVDVAPLALAVRILRMVKLEMDADGASSASELVASLQAARRIVQEVFNDLEAASARGAS